MKGLATPRPGSERMTLCKSAFAVSTGFATGSHGSLQISQHSFALAVLSVPERFVNYALSSCQKIANEQENL